MTAAPSTVGSTLASTAAVIGSSVWFADFGYVYLMGCEGRLKVGKAIKPAQRRKGHQTGNPFAVRIVRIWRVASMCHAEDRLKSALSPWHVRGEWFMPPPNVRRELLEIRCLDTLIRTGRDLETVPAPGSPPIPESFAPNGGTFGIVSPRATVWHRLVRDGDRVRSLCGQAELTPDNYWRLRGKSVLLSMRNRECEACDALHSANAPAQPRREGGVE